MRFLPLSLLKCQYAKISKLTTQNWFIKFNIFYIYMIQRGKNTIHAGRCDVLSLICFRSMWYKEDIKYNYFD